MTQLTLPIDSDERKEYSISRGCMAYFPAAIAGVARHSFKAGAKHTQGQLVHKRWLSGDHEDCIERHLMDLRDLRAELDRGTIGEGLVQEAILCEADALAWRALALNQELKEKFGKAPLAPAARLKEEAPGAVPAGITPQEFVEGGKAERVGAVKTILAHAASLPLADVGLNGCPGYSERTKSHCVLPSVHRGDHKF